MLLSIYIQLFTLLVIWDTWITELGNVAITEHYHMQGIFGGCKPWQNGKENIIGGMNFGSFVTEA